MTDSIVFDRAAGFYDATRGFPPGVEQAVADAFVRAGGLGPASRLVEIGVGTGRIALPLAARVGRIVGVDRSAPMLAKLVEKRGELPVDLVRADGARLPLADASADAAVAVHVFHLIPSWRDVLAELARVLRPGGLLLHGGDDQSRDETWASWRRARTRLAAEVENVGVPHARVESFLEDEGWRLATVERVRFARRIRPRAVLDGIEARSWSLTWRLSDAQLAEAAAALRDDLVASFGDLDREVELEAGFWVRAYQTGSGGSERHAASSGVGSQPHEPPGPKRPQRALR